MMRSKANEEFNVQRDAFNTWMKTGEVSNALTTSDGGGVHIPESVEGEVYDLAKGYGPALRVFDLIVTEKAGPVGSPVIDDEDNDAEQRASEDESNTEIDPALGGLVLNDYQFRSGVVKASRKLVRSAGYGFADAIRNTLVQRLARKITIQSMIGAGGGSAITGLANAAAAGVTTSAAGDFAFSELYDLIETVDAAYAEAPGSGLIMSRDMLTECFKKDDSSNRLKRYLSRTPDGYEFAGFPIYAFPSLPAVAGAAVPCFFGDPMAYKLRLVGEPRFYQSIESGSSEQIEFYAFWDADGGLADSNAIKKLTIA